MEAELKEHVAFHLTGRRPALAAAADERLELRPALLARYRDLTQLRYDFPLVLVRGAAADRSCVQSLSAIFDGLAHAVADADDSERVTHHLLRLEQQIRGLAAAGASGWLSALWERAVQQLTARGDASVQLSLARARAALKVDGEVVDCGRALPANLVRHAWNAVQEQKARRFRADTGRLILKLSDILHADFAQSKAGRSADHLRSAMGGADSDIFNFEAMSQVLGKTAARSALPESRHRRIENLLKVLRSQRFYSGLDGATSGKQTYAFVFDKCSTALAAWRERLPAALELARAIAVAKLEIDAQYREDRHDALFAAMGDDQLDGAEMALLPDYLVCLGAAQLQGAESERLMEILSAGLPVKVLTQTDDLLEEAALGGDAHLGFGLRGKQLANLAIGLNEVYVLQAPASHLYQFRERIVRGMHYAGPALFNVFSGAGGKSRDLPPYLVAAAAMESRAFPAYTFDPSAGANWAARFDLAANPQAELDWPLQTFDYEDEKQQRVSEKLTFTVIDFVAADSRYARHFVRVSRAAWGKNLLPASECCGRQSKGIPDQLPCLMMVDRQNNLQKVIVDDKLLRAAQRCREAWHSLQELGGIHNSHAERLLEHERAEWQAREQEAKIERAAPTANAPAVTAAPTAEGVAAAAVDAAAAVEEPARSPDEAYIETARCTTCNECTTVNNKLFAYNENKQAYIADPDAGTYRQMIEAAENCQIAIIHPGKPRNKNEPGLDELLKRAELFS